MVKKILLAEDDLDDQQFFLHFLKSRNDIVLLPVATDGVMVLEQLNQIAETSALPDVIILDQNMPRQNGLQTVELLKKDHRYAHISVIIYSTYADSALKRKGVEAGACLVVPKPLSKDEYHKMMDLILQTCC